MKRNRNYEREFKQEVLRMVERSDKSIADLEREFGLSRGLIRKWQERYQLKTESRELARSDESEAEAEIRRLKRELEIARQERDILKKAVAVFSRETRS